MWKNNLLPKESARGNTINEAIKAPQTEPLVMSPRQNARLVESASK